VWRQAGWAANKKFVRTRTLVTALSTILAMTLEASLPVVDINSSRSKEIRAELFRLFQLQLDALDSATLSLAGLTRAGWLEYGKRETRIRELRKELGFGPQKKRTKMDLLKIGGSRHLQ